MFAQVPREHLLRELEGARTLETSPLVPLFFYFPKHGT